MSRRKRKRIKRRPVPARPARQPAKESPPSPDDEQIAIRIHDALWTLPRLIQQMAEEARQTQRRARERQRAAFQSGDASLAECIAPYTKNGLTGMLDALEITGAKGLLKAAMAERIVEELSDPRRLAAIVGRLTNREREALRFVLSHGGKMPSANFARHYDHDLDESPFWGYPTHQPKSVMGRLRVRGLLAEGVLEGGQAMILIPHELKGPLEKLLIEDRGG